MCNTQYRIRTAEAVHLSDGQWRATAFIHEGENERPIKILLHAGRSRERESARLQAIAAAQEVVESLQLPA